MRMNRQQERRAWTEYITGERSPKYGNEIVMDAGGRKFHSKLEAMRAAELELLVKLGEISDLRFQVPFELVPAQKGERPALYIADFVYHENGELIVEDAKGAVTREFVLKRKLMLHRHGIRLRITTFRK